MLNPSVSHGEVELMKNGLVELVWTGVKFKLPVAMYSFALFNVEDKLLIVGGKMVDKVTNNRI